MESIISAIPRNSVKILPATWRDVNAVHRLGRVCFPKDAWPIWDIVGVLTLPKVIRLKAINEGHIVGFVAVDKRPSEDLAWIAIIGVLPDYRERGIASALLRTCEKRVDLSRIKLSVRASNQQAIYLYRRNGYKQVEVWPLYYQDREDALVLEKQLL